MPISDKFKAIASKKEESELDKKYRLPAGGADHLFNLENKYGIQHKGILLSMINTETGSEKDRANAVSKRGAMGWMQFMPRTAKAYKVNPRDFYSSTEGAAKMVASLQKQYSGDLDKMLAGYNWGSGNLARKGMEGMPKETKEYLTRNKTTLAEVSSFTKPKQGEGNKIEQQGVIAKPDWKFPLNLLSPTFKKLMGFEEAKIPTPENKS